MDRFYYPLSKKIHDIFTITQLTRVFEIYPDVEEALASFAHAAREHEKHVVSSSSCV